MKSVLLSINLVLMAFSSALHADSLTVEYATFYSHLNKIDSEETPSLQFAFGFKNIDTGSLCIIESARIETQKVTIDVDVSPENRFLLPTEKALKQARAIVEIELKEKANKCDISVQLETTRDALKTSYTKQELSDLLQQYTTFFDDMGGFLSFLMPGVTGLHFHFSDTNQLDLPLGATQEGNHLFLSEQAFKKNYEFPIAPYRITAVTE